MFEPLYVLLAVLAIVVFAAIVLVHPRVRGKATTPGALGDEVVAPIPKLVRYNTRAGRIVTARVVRVEGNQYVLRRRGHPNGSEFRRTMQG